MYALCNVHVLTPTCTVQYVISCAVNIRLQLYTCFLIMRSKHASSKILNDIGRNSVWGNRKKIAKFLMRTFTCRSTFLYAYNIPPSLQLLTYNRSCAWQLAGQYMRTDIPQQHSLFGTTVCPVPKLQPPRELRVCYLGQATWRLCMKPLLPVTVDFSSFYIKNTKQSKTSTSY
jgi:hypothetical protein